EALMSVRSGWDTGIPTADMSPGELAPTRQDTLLWPKWGNYYETSGKSGEPIDLAPAQELMKLNTAWNTAKSAGERKAAWDRILQIHAEQTFTIGTVSGVLQPIVVSVRLRNVPDRGVFSWDPGAQFDMYRMDEFWFAQ